MKNRLYYMIILLFFTIIMLSSTTYAWFTHNRIVTIRTINIHVQASGGIEISADAINFKAVIDPDDIADARGLYPRSVNQIPNVMEPVSTGKEIDNNTGFLKMFYGTADSDESGNNLLSSIRSIETEGHGENSDGKFIAFDMFFRTYNDIDIYLTSDSGVSYKDNSTEKGIAASSRIAFLLSNNLPIGTNPGTLQQLKNTSPDMAYIWEPNYDVHTSAAVQHASSVYGLTLPNINGPKISYDGLIGEFDKSDNVSVRNANSTSFPNLFKKVNIDYYTEKNFNNYVKVFNLKQGITKVRIYMWIEGQDVDCEDDASLDDIMFNLQFTINPS